MFQPARIRIIVRGLVQGVFFRANTREKAQQLGISGWVRNLDSDKVEIVAEGEGEKLKELIEWTKEGPSSATVEKVETDWQPYQGELEGFEIRY